MAAFNVVRFRVKPGNEQRFVDVHRQMRPAFKGFVRGDLIQTGEQTYCMIGEWRDFASIVDARPEMIGLLDSMREMLEDLGGGLGVTDPVSGVSVVRLGAPKAASKKAASKKRPAKKRAAPTGKRKKRRAAKKR